MKYVIGFIFIIGILIAFVVGVYTAPMLNPEINIVKQIESEELQIGFVEVNISIEGTTVTLTNNCNAITFDVTEDQAFSIAYGIERLPITRPLTHDILNDILESFDIQVTQISIDRFEENIYKARMFLKQGNRTLDLDVRPSDAIALSTRLGKTLYIEENILKSRSVRVC